MNILVIIKHIKVEELILADVLKSTIVFKEWRFSLSMEKRYSKSKGIVLTTIVVVIALIILLSYIIHFYR